MENNIFHHPAVAGILRQHYVEARLHVDHPEPALEAANDALQAELQGSVGTPYYVLIDPRTGAERARFGGSTFDPEVFAAFLREGAEGESSEEEVALSR